MRGQGFLAWFYPPTHQQLRYSSKLSQQRMDGMQQRHVQVTSSLRSRALLAIAMVAALVGLSLVDGSGERRQQFEEKYGAASATGEAAE